VLQPTRPCCRCPSADRAARPTRRPRRGDCKNLAVVAAPVIFASGVIDTAAPPAASKMPPPPPLQVAAAAKPSQGSRVRVCELYMCCDKYF
jgi:hypothetical protein